MQSFDKLLGRFNGNPPASEVMIRQFEAESGLRLDEGYRSFLLQSNGGEGFIGSLYLILWRVEELLEFCKAYRVEEYAPGLFLFGSDGGGDAFAFDLRNSESSVVLVPFVGMDLTLVDRLADNFLAFLVNLSEK
jgi:hypothetical protein